MRGLEGSHLSHAGTIIRDRINVIYTDTPFEFQRHLAVIGAYADELRDASMRALDEEAVLIAVLSIRHAA